MQQFGLERARETRSPHTAFSVRMAALVTRDALVRSHAVQPRLAAARFDSSEGLPSGSYVFGIS